MCPFCNTAVIYVSIAAYPNGNEDEAYRVGCNCGWAARRIRKWYSNKVQLIGDWNSYILDADYKEITEPNGSVIK